MAATGCQHRLVPIEKPFIMVNTLSATANTFFSLRTGYILFGHMLFNNENLVSDFSMAYWIVRLVSRLSGLQFTLNAWNTFRIDWKFLLYSWTICKRRDGQVFLLQNVKQYKTIVPPHLHTAHASNIILNENSTWITHYMTISLLLMDTILCDVWVPRKNEY